MSGCSSPRDFFFTARQRCASGRAWLALPAPRSSATRDVRQLKVSGWCSPDTDWYTCKGRRHDQGGVGSVHMLAGEPAPCTAGNQMQSPAQGIAMQQPHASHTLAYAQIDSE